MTGQVFNLFRQAKRLHKRAKRSGNVTHYDHFNLKRSEAKATFKLARDKYYVDIADKLADPNTSTKAYWRLTKLAYGQKAASETPHLLEADRLITDDGEKCSTFNIFLAVIVALTQLRISIILFLFLHIIHHIALMIYLLHLRKSLK